MKKFLVILVPALLFVPVLVHAQTAPQLGWFQSLITQLQGIVGLLVPLFVGLAVVVFLYGIVKYIFSGGADESRKEGIKFMIWGLVGVFAAVSIWGLVELIRTMVGVGAGGAPPPLPGLPGEAVPPVGGQT